MRSVSDIINKLGSENIQRLLDVKEYSIRAAKRQRKFPARWFAVIEAECMKLGIQCPRDLFAFKEPHVEDSPATSETEVGA
jgi:hypothetical protein